MFLASQGLNVVIFLFLLIAAVMSIFIPFWVFRIRNESISANLRLAALIDLQKAQLKELQTLE